MRKIDRGPSRCIGKSVMAQHGQPSGSLCIPKADLFLLAASLSANDPSATWADTACAVMKPALAPIYAPVWSVRTPVGRGQKLLSDSACDLSHMIEFVVPLVTALAGLSSNNPATGEFIWSNRRIRQ